MTKRIEMLGAAIALGLFLNAAASFYRILEPAPVTAQAAITDVNVVRVGGLPLAVNKYDDGEGAPYTANDPRFQPGNKADKPLFVKVVP